MDKGGWPRRAFLSDWNKMKDIDIEGKIHWSGKERLIVVSAGLGFASIACASIWWFNSHIPVRSLQALWFIPNFVIGISGLLCAIIALFPRRTLWLADIIGAIMDFN